MTRRTPWPHPLYGSCQHTSRFIFSKPSPASSFCFLCYPPWPPVASQDKVLAFKAPSQSRASVCLSSFLSPPHPCVSFSPFFHPPHSPPTPPLTQSLAGPKCHLLQAAQASSSELLWA